MQTLLIKSCFPVCFMLVLGNPVMADQRSERLDTLLNRLAVEHMPGKAQSLERDIWTLWMDSGDEAVNHELSIGVNAMNEGLMQEAIIQFSKVTEMASDFAEGWNKRATAYYFDHQLEKSMQDIRRALELEPRHFGAISGMGLIFMSLGDDRAALRAFEAVLNLYPMSPSARAHVEALRRKLKDQMV